MFFDWKIFKDCCLFLYFLLVTLVGLRIGIVPSLVWTYFSTITAWHCLLRNAGSHYYSVSRRCDASWILFLPVHIYSSSTMCGVEYKNSLGTYTLRILFTAIGKNPIGIIKKRNKLNITLMILNPSISWNVI